MEFVKCAFSKSIIQLLINVSCIFTLFQLATTHVTNCNFNFYSDGRRALVYLSGRNFKIFTSNQLQKLCKKQVISISCFKNNYIVAKQFFTIILILIHRTFF
jgi:hypothetical protein